MERFGTLMNHPQMDEDERGLAGRPRWSHLRRPDTGVSAWAYLNKPPMTAAKKITAAKSNPVTIFLFRERCEIAGADRIWRIAFTRP
jgi:hypothetical protein